VSGVSGDRSSGLALQGGGCLPLARHRLLTYECSSDALTAVCGDMGGAMGCLRGMVPLGGGMNAGILGRSPLGIVGTVPQGTAAAGDRTLGITAHGAHRKRCHREWRRLAIAPGNFCPQGTPPAAIAPGNFCPQGTPPAAIAPGSCDKVFTYK